MAQDEFSIDKPIFQNMMTSFLKQDPKETNQTPKREVRFYIYPCEKVITSQDDDGKDFREKIVGTAFAISLAENCTIILHEYKRKAWSEDYSSTFFTNTFDFEKYKYKEVPQKSFVSELLQE